MVLLAVFLLVRVVEFTEPKEKNEKGAEQLKGFDKLRLTDLEFTHHQLGHKIFTIHIGEILHKKRKLGPFTINPIKELELNNVAIDIFHDQPPSRSEETDSIPKASLYPIDLSSLTLRSILGQSFRAKELGFISRVRVNTIKMIGLQNNQEQWSLVANRGELSGKKKRMVFKGGVTILTKEGQSVETNKLEWWNDKNAFYAPEEYVMKDDEGAHRASGAFIAISIDGKILRIE